MISIHEYNTYILTGWSSKDASAWAIIKLVPWEKYQRWGLKDAGWLL